MIPEIDGLAVIRRARELGDVPILILSARGAVGDRILGLSEGADDYLPKPFSPAELVVRVRTILRRAERRAGGLRRAWSSRSATSSSMRRATRSRSQERRSCCPPSSCDCWRRCSRPTDGSSRATACWTRSTATARAT